MLSNYITSLIRTAVPGTVGWLLSLPFAAAVCHLAGVDTATATRYVSAAVAFVLALAYYALVRALEQKFPQLGVLLGVPVRPSYSAAAKGYDLPDTPDPLALTGSTHEPETVTPETEPHLVDRLAGAEHTPEHAADQA